jgi:hypothetical protein
MPIHLEVGPRHQRGPFSLVRMLGGETKNDAIAAQGGKRVAKHRASPGSALWKI